MSHSILRPLASVASLGFAAVGAMVLPGHAQAAGAIRAAFVEAVIPSKPFSALVTASPGATPFVGPIAGVLGVTSLTLSNNTSGPSGVTLNVLAVPDGIDCESANFSHGIILYRAAAHVPPLQTLQLVYPSPWVIGAGLSVPAGRHVCLGAELISAVGAITVHVSGLVN